MSLPIITGVGDYNNISADVDGLYSYITEEIVRYATQYLESVTCSIENERKRPHWRSRAKKHSSSAHIIMGLAKPHVLKNLIDEAKAHFEQNPRHRAFNILVSSVHVATFRSRDSKKPKKFYHYNFGIRIHKRRVMVKDGNLKYRMLIYLANVGRLCPLGRYIHMRVEKDKNNAYIFHNNRKTF